MAQTGFARQFGWRPPKPPGKYSSSGGGVAFNPNRHFKAPPAAGGGLTSPPPGTFDPALEAQRRAAQRGMHDTLADVRTKEHFGAQRLHEALTDIKTSVSRKRQKLGIDFQRGNQKLGNQESDTRLRAGRAEQDYSTRLSNISRQFGELGQRQGEAANVAGVGDTGTATASAAARARQQAIAEEPIHTAQGRLHEDLATALSRIGTARGQLGQDYGIAGSQLKQDREHERRSARRETGQKDFELHREAQRARREGAISNVDLLEQEVYNARQEHPTAFANTAQQALGGNKKKGRR